MFLNFLQNSSLWSFTNRYALKQVKEIMKVFIWRSKEGNKWLKVDYDSKCCS